MRDTRSSPPSPHSLTRVLLKITLSLALLLGLVAAILQLILDLKQQKSAVEIAAEEFLVGVVPSAASAAYNYQYDAAKEVARGLFSQRAIKQVIIVNDGEVMVDASREIEPTLPRLMQLTDEDKVTLSRDLIRPNSQSGTKIGTIQIVVDRSIVSPSIVDRMMSYFVLALLKNVAFGLALVFVVYGTLARHLVKLADIAASWKPDHDQLLVPRPPAFLAGTEIDVLGKRIENLSESALEVIRLKSESEKELSQRSIELEEMVQRRTSELETANEKLKLVADSDALTQLLNRGALDRELASSFEEALENDLAFAIALLDVDHFKLLNDTYGHQIGDACLVSIAGVLANTAKAHGCILGRYGGEEFCLGGNGIDLSQMSDIAAEVHAAIKELDIPHSSAPQTRRVTVSIGVSAVENRERTLDNLIGEADRALYDAKKLGRNRTARATPEDAIPLGHKRRSDTDVMQALREQRYEPFFQPQIDARTGEIVGAETLARLRLEDDTILAPQAFIPKITESGALAELDRLILDKTRHMLARASHWGHAVPRLSFNMHPSYLRNKDTMRDFTDLQSQCETKIAVELLEMWSSETLDEEALWGLECLRDAGIDVEIDDFGTSKASIVALHCIAPDRIKIAQELVFPMPQSAKYRRTVDCILQLAERLDISVIAEGVETEEHMRLLLDCGCYVQQGFYFARALSEQAFFAMLSDEPRRAAQ